ncbi:phosphatidylinositide phosphatase SAC1like protein putative [Powellomyces hirtus]|nr:phosphatidylinositide phosphatase SAC1like protein putative [Powellomyces hirtus]
MQKQVVAVEKHMLSRLLYPNPVCLLTVTGTEELAVGAEMAWKRSVMTISWLTAIDNHGRFVCSMNVGRHSYTILKYTNLFVLNVATAGMQSMVASIGSCSGKNQDKFAALALPTCLPGYSTLDWPLNPSPAGSFPPLLAIYGAAAHLECRVEERQERHGHAILFCVIDRAWARTDYWNGKNLGSKTDPLLSFLGTKVFADIVPQ